METKIKSRPLPHEVWPPDADKNELDELAFQRNADIRIKGRSGPIKEFETAFLQFLDNKLKYSVSFNSGTSGLFAAYFAIGIEEGDIVLGPGLTYHAALSPVYSLRGDVKLVDVDINSRCIDANLIEQNICDKTKAITVVHQWGHPADMDKILKIADKYNLRVVEDCSHAHGSRYKGRLCGTFGDVAVFSLQANKAIFAGEGGILVTNNETIYNRATLIGHYRDRSKEDIADPDYQKYWVSGFGLKLRMSPFNAIVAKHSLSLYPKRKEGRHKCLNYFNERLKEIDYITPLSIPENIDMGAWYGFKPLFKAGVISLSREEFVHMMQKQGMEISAPSGGALASLPLYSESPDLMYPNKTSKYQNDIRSCPICQKIEDTGLSLPTFYDWDNDKELIDEYIELFKEVLDKYRL